MSKLIENIQNVLNFCATNFSRKALKTSSGQAKITTQHLLTVAKSLKLLIPSTSLEKLDITISYGSGFFPKVPWVAIVPVGKRVSNSISVAICFGSNGEGLVAGAMFPNAVDLGPFKTKSRSESEEGSSYINISGINNRTKYNDKFINPRNFTKEQISEDDLVNHLNESILIMKQYLNQVNKA
ncbi:hypothetical protein [Methylotenera sp.]|uniref:hypothetical protein n=1 Tax=Methylotenera sp. TaxID=2051956 RepID=UPI0024885BA1|nr:hypothetical protein [Methylotenera sp.]MDI1361960.1 hypothetical protein [Methylotenera sp.]